MISKSCEEGRTPHVSAENDMVLHVLADGREVELDRDARGLQGRTGPNAAELEDVWRLDGPVEESDLDDEQDRTRRRSLS